VKVLVVILALTLGLAQVATVPASTGSEAAKPVLQATLAELRRDPVAWRGKRVELTLQFDAPLATWRPWLTRFDERHYLGFSAWGDEQLLWLASEHASPSTRLFARRGTDAELYLRAAPTYRRFRVTCVLRNVFEVQAWIEVLAVEPLERAIGQGALVHAGRAVDLEAEGHDAAAAEQYERALASPAPASMRAALEEALERARSRSEGTPPEPAEGE